jgi:hypothetical protein
MAVSLSAWHRLGALNQASSATTSAPPLKTEAAGGNMTTGGFATVGPDVGQLSGTETLSRFRDGATKLVD